MVSDAMYILSVAFALVTGTSAGLLSILTWEILRYSPLGRVLFVLAIVQVVFILYHVLILVLPEAVFLQHFIHSVMYTTVAVAVWMLVWVQRAIKRRADEEAQAA